MLNEGLAQELQQFQKQHLTRKRYVIQEREGKHLRIDDQQCISFCSSDYLNLACDDRIKKAFITGVEKYGVGSGSAALISGYYQANQDAEIAFADFMQRERALLFNSGYHANLAVMTCFANRHKTVLADKYCHASILDGVQLSRAKLIRFNHNVISHAAECCEISSPDLIVTESVFSMEGDVSPIKSLVELAKQQRAMLIVDDAHSLGVLGDGGRGITEVSEVASRDIDCLISPLGKAFAGQGAFVTGSDNVIEALLQFARSYRYTTAMPPAMSVAIQETMKIIQTETFRRKRLQQLITYFIKAAEERNLTLINKVPTPIQAILIGSNQQTMAIQQACLQRGFFISAIRPPTVPDNTARLRISLMSSHTELEIDALLDSIKSAYEQN